MRILFLLTLLLSLNCFPVYSEECDSSEYSYTNSVKMVFVIRDEIWKKVQISYGNRLIIKDNVNLQDDLNYLIYKYKVRNIIYDGGTRISFMFYNNFLAECNFKDSVKR